jgi:hypothetical protein
MSRGCMKVAAYAAAGMMALSTADVVRSQQGASKEESERTPTGPLVRAVRESTSLFRDVEVAVATGYELAGGCVSGPEQGAMGMHFVNPKLVGDGELDAAQPEVLVYEPQGDGLELVAAEYLVIADDWNSRNSHPPVLEGQHFHYVPAPNRTGLPAHYELHVWAWKWNPHGTFVDWNTRVKCDDASAPL